MSRVSRRTAKLAVPAALAALCLTGCAGLRPGVAAEVGEDTITTRELDTFAKGLCAFYATQSSPETSANTRNRALSILVRSSLANDYGDRTDIQLDQDAISQQVRGVADAVKDLPSDEREAFLDQVRDSLEGDQYALEVGTARLTAAGEEPSNDALSAAITEIYTEWADDAGVELDPRFGTWDKVEAKQGSGSLSVATENDDATGTALPGSQTCH